MCDETLRIFDHTVVACAVFYPAVCMYLSIYALSFFISQRKRGEYDKLDFYHTFITMTAEHSHDNNVNSLKICSDGKLFKCAHFPQVLLLNTIILLDHREGIIALIVIIFD